MVCLEISLATAVQCSLANFGRVYAFTWAHGEDCLLLSTRGQTGRRNGKTRLEYYLRCFVNFGQDDYWARWLPLTQFTYNHFVHSSIDVDVEMEESSAP